MHVSCPPAKPVQQLSPGASGDMFAFWKLAARMRVCHVPFRLHHTTVAVPVATRSSAGTFVHILLIPFLHLFCMWLCTSDLSPTYRHVSSPDSNTLSPPYSLQSNSYRSVIPLSLNDLHSARLEHAMACNTCRCTSTSAKH